MLLAGRICLIKFVLIFIPLFVLSLFKMPSVVTTELARIQRNFLWGWDADEIAWSSWSKVCDPCEASDLGILDLRVFNTTLLGKWIWRLGSDKGGMWKEILDSKYGGWRSLREGVNIGRTSLWWKDLMEVWWSEGWGRNFEDAFKWKIGNGDSVLFWEDCWAGNGVVKRVYPRLFSLSSYKDAKVVELGKWINGSWEWQLTWRRSLFEWEKPLVSIFSRVFKG